MYLQRNRRFLGSFAPCPPFFGRKKSIAPPGEVGTLASPIEDFRTEKLSPLSRTPPGHSPCCYSHTGRLCPELEIRGCSQKDDLVLPQLGITQLTHLSPGEGLSLRFQLRCPLRPRDGAVRSAAEHPRVWALSALAADSRQGLHARIPVAVPASERPRDSGAGKRPHRNLAEVNQQLVSYPSVTHQLPINYHQFCGAADQPQGQRRGNSGLRPGLAGGARGARFSLPSC